MIILFIFSSYANLIINMVKSPNKLLNKKRKKNISKIFIKKPFKRNKNITINIKNSIYSFENLQENETNEIFKKKKFRKSNIVKKIEKSKISYAKCNYNSINEISYKCKKLINIPKQLYEYQNLSKSLLFLRLIHYKQKTILFIGYIGDLLIYEIFEENIYLISSFNEKKKIKEITNIFLLDDNNLSNKLKFFFIINNKGILCEFSLKDYIFNIVEERILYEEGNAVYIFKNINNNKLFMYNYTNSYIYNIINNKKKILTILQVDRFNNIQNCQKLKENLYIIILDDKLFIFNSLTDSLLCPIETELHFYWKKVLPLKDNQFLFYSSLAISIFDFNYEAKESPKLNRKLQLNNIMNIKKIKQVTNGDLVINYNFYNLVIYDLKKNIIKYRIIGQKVDGNTILHYFSIIKEIEPNIIAYKKNLNQINFLNIVKGENIGNFSEENNNILVFKKIKVNSIENDENNHNGEIFYFILTNNSSFIIYK